MSHVRDREIRKRRTEDRTYYVLGEQVRKDILTVVDTLKAAPKPLDYNHNDEDALDTMYKWITKERDFNNKQWIKFGRMLSKYELPSTIKELASELGWDFGANLSKHESYEIMQERRDKESKAKIAKFRQSVVTNYTVTQQFNRLFYQE